MSKTVAVLALIVFDKEVEPLTEDGEIFDSISDILHSGCAERFEGEVYPDYITACVWPDDVAADIMEMAPGPEKDMLDSLHREKKVNKRPELKVVWHRGRSKDDETH